MTTWIIIFLLGVIAFPAGIKIKEEHKESFEDACIWGIAIVLILVILFLGLGVFA